LLSRKLIFGLATLSLAFALAACGTAPLTPDTTPTFAPTTPQVAPTATEVPTTAPTTAPTSVPTTAPSADTSITFEKTGGIAGIHDSLEIDSQGEASYTSGSISRKQTLPATTYEMLLQQIEAADFFNLEENYDTGNVADDFYYTITVKQGDRANTVKVAAAGGESLTPQGLKDLIAQLVNIQNSLSSTGTTITFVTTGGIAGISDTLKISPDLKVVYSSRGFPDKKTLISGDQYNKLLAQIDKADFFNLNDTYQGAVPDAFVYTITVADQNRNKTVTTSETSEMPRDLKDLISQLEDVQNTVQ